VVTLVVTLTALASGATLAGTAGAAGSGDLRKKAAEIQDQIDQSDLQISALGEQLDAATTKRDAADAQVADADARINAAKAEVHRVLKLVRENAASLYRNSSQKGTATELDVSRVDDLSRRNRYADVQAARDAQLLDQLDAAKQDLSARRAEAKQARDEFDAESQRLASAKAAIENARAQQQAILNQVNGQLAAAVAAERAAREAAARARYTRPVSYPNVGPPNGSASQAIAFARGVIGSPYSTNPRMGPSYDCSGLTYMSWHAAGVQIPTTSSTQYAALPHVPLNAIQPGDLIFYGPGGSQHVALYVGGGMIIDASSSQNAVVERAIWGNPVGAARVT